MSNREWLWKLHVKPASKILPPFSLLFLVLVVRSSRSSRRSGTRSRGAAGYERMTLVQEATLPVILKGKEVLAKTKTGIGKTVVFLLPAIEIVSKLPPVGRDQKRPPINVLVICLTCELADQVGTEANTLLKFRLALEQKRMQANPCQILVAAPGRLRDHI